MGVDTRTMRALLICALVSAVATAQGPSRSVEPETVTLPSGLFGAAVVTFVAVLAFLWLLLPFAVFRIRRDMIRLVQLAEWATKQSQKP